MYLNRNTTLVYNVEGIYSITFVFYSENLLLIQNVCYRLKKNVLNFNICKKNQVLTYIISKVFLSIISVIILIYLL